MTGFSWSVEVDPIVLASGNVDLKPLRGSVVRVHNPVLRETLCGLACEVFADKDKADSTNLDPASPAHPLARLTLGGLICVDNQCLYALTTAHSFIESSKQNDTFAHIPNSAYDFFGEIYHFEYLDRLVSLGSEENPTTTKWAWDWALLRFDRSVHSKPNSFQPQLPRAPRMFIESHLTTKELSDGEVWVCSASKGPRLAMLYADRTLMTIENSTFEARSIGLAEELADGDSGSWVVQEGKLLFREISRVLSHTSDKSISVEVATRAEIERAHRKGLSSKPWDSEIVPASRSDPPRYDPELYKDAQGGNNRLTDLDSGGTYVASDTEACKPPLTREPRFPAPSPWGSKISPASGSDPLRNKPELSEGLKGDNDLSTNFGTGASRMPSDTKAYRSPAMVENRFKDPETDKKGYRDSVAASLPRLIQFLAVSFDSHHIDNMINEPNVTEKIRQLFQRVKWEDIACRDSVRNLITTYGDATALTLLKVSCDSKFFDDAIIAIEDKLTKALGMRKTKFLFEILASMEKCLRYLHNIADKSQRKPFMQFLLGRGFMKQVFNIEVLLSGLELSIDQLRHLLSEPALHQSLQQMRLKKSLFNIELELELYRSLSEACTVINAINPVVCLGLLHSPTQLSSAMAQYGRQQLSIICSPSGVHGQWEKQLSYDSGDEIKRTPWKSQNSVWAPSSFILDRDSRWKCEIDQHNASIDGIYRVNNISFLADMLENQKSASALSRTPISFEDNAHHMVVYKDPEIDDPNSLGNMAEFFEDESQKRNRNPMNVSSGRFIGFVLNLSYLILSLSSTPWVEEDWTWENILVTRNRGDPDEEPEVFIVHKFHSADGIFEQAGLWVGSEPQILNEPLTRLGIALTELAFRKRLEGSDDEFIFKTAMQLSDSGQIAVREGRIYGDVVKACLTYSYPSGSEIKIISRGRPDFQDAVMEAILSPLHALWSSSRKDRDRKSHVQNSPLRIKGKAPEAKSQERSTPFSTVPSGRLESDETTVEDIFS
ncbi:hypothetical protein MMC22_005809 [Lobaria immixta]|nr:hypothetical protein [Lobaria immixta]